MFTTGDNPHGCGHVLRTVYKGVRTTGADFLLHAGSNLTIKTEVTVDRVILEAESFTKRAVAVRVIEKDGQVHIIKARREIIVSGGAYCSPPILMRSGIGPEQELEKIGIECIVNLPGVGQNLMDHLVSLASRRGWQ